MAHFHKLPGGERVSGQTLTVSASSVTLGLWGYLDPHDNSELTVGTSAPGVKAERKGVVSSSRAWLITSNMSGRTRVEARTRNGDVWDWVELTFAPGVSATPGGTKFTNSPLEVATRRTTPTPQEVVAMLREGWSNLTDTGARTLTAQFMAETGGGRYCFNWNLGNVKAGPNVQHMYLRGVWEVDTPGRAEAQVARSNGMAHVATADEIKKKGWSCPPGKAVAVFEPPHPQCRFRAYQSLSDGAQRWLTHHQAIASRNPTFMDMLNTGNIGGVAHALKVAGYYTAGEADYARAMTRTKAEVDRAMGQR